jgi:2-keto-4-pentenoate hydratase/2-oxohepta-3-ene-1,7-dioic acid hydratase in catechol pathway
MSVRIVRYASPAGARYGLVENDTLFELHGDPYGDCRPGAEVGPLAGAELLAPVQPTTIVCVGNNYDELLKVKGLQRPEIPNVFLKAANAVVGPGADVVKPTGQRFEFEGELTLVIGATASKVKAADWRDHVRGFTIGNDLSARDWQLNDTQWWRAKSSDTFCPVGPWIETEVEDPENLTLRTLVNGEAKQDSSTRDLTFKLGEVLEIVTAQITLQPGDIVLTGTPPGFIPLFDGDVVEVEIEGLGTLRNTVRDEA